MEKVVVQFLVALGLIVGGAAVFGWIHNIFLLVHMDCGWCAKEIVRVIGIFMAPLGIVMGFVS